MAVKAEAAVQAAPGISLANVVKGKQEVPMRVLIYGTPGIGKSTFAAAAPSPIFISPEEGTHHLDVARFSKPDFSWRDAIDSLVLLENEKHPYKTVVIDTLDSLEPLNWAHICARDRKKNLEDYNYGKGFQVAVDEWRSFIAALERVWRKGMNVVMVGHSVVRSYSPATDKSWDRFDLNLHKSKGQSTTNVPGMFYNWSDYVLFANYETATIEDEKTKRVRGVETGSRLIHTQWSAAFEAKSRSGVPETLPLSWSEFEEAVNAGKPADPAALTEEIKRKAKLLGGALEAKTEEGLKRAGNDAVKLAQLNSWQNAKLAEKGIEQ